MSKKKKITTTNKFIYLGFKGYIGKYHLIKQVR